jgi:hypothetical protein
MWGYTALSIEDDAQGGYYEDASLSFSFQSVWMEQSENQELFV